MPFTVDALRSDFRNIGRAWHGRIDAPNSQSGRTPPIGTDRTLKFAIILDNSSLTVWQADALALIADQNRFTIFNCTNSGRRRRSLKHALYYLLNFVSLRNDLTRRIALPLSMNPERQFDFECEFDGAWERLPKSLLKTISDDPPEFILKFGMGLLRVPSVAELPIPILSYHHGDPRAFRGRPAGFYEMLLGQKSLGQVIQILSNRLDGGRIVAFGETKVQQRSYRATMKEAYRCSPLLLPQAVRNVLDGRALDIAADGTVYRLPSSLKVLRFAYQRLRALLRHLAYGAFYEKAWSVAEAMRPLGELRFQDFPKPAEWRTIVTPKGYRFLADPFYHPRGDGILVEGLNGSSGVGQILHLSASGPRILLGGKRHYSFPATVRIGDEDFIVPEVSEWSRPMLFNLEESRATCLGELKIPSGPRLLDPSFLVKEGVVYLFANISTEGNSVLRLWLADSISNRFAEHPRSPIRISPAGSRMGGMLIEQADAHYRIGQNFEGHYGDGVILFRIDQLTTLDYRETRIDELRFDQSSGPHTLNLGRDSVVFDHYVDRFSIFAGARRLRARLARVAD